jgi:hypothetical protein
MALVVGADLRPASRSPRRGRSPRLMCRPRSRKSPPKQAAAEATATTLHTPPATAHADDDEFNDTSGMSGPVNGLDAKWTRHNLAGTLIKTDWSAVDEWLLLDVTASQATDQAITQPVPAGDFHVMCAAAGFVVPGRQMWGLFVADNSGNGYVVSTDNGDTDYVRTLSAWAAGSPTGSGSVANVDGAFFAGNRVVMEIQRVGTTYTFSMTSSDFLKHSFRAQGSVTTATTYTKIGFGRIYTDNGGATAVGLDYFRVTEP